MAKRREREREREAGAGAGNGEQGTGNGERGVRSGSGSGGVGGEEEVISVYQWTSTTSMVYSLYFNPSQFPLINHRDTSSYVRIGEADRETVKVLDPAQPSSSCLAGLLTGLMVALRFTHCNPPAGSTLIISVKLTSSLISLLALSVCFFDFAGLSVGGVIYCQYLPSITAICTCPKKNAI
ncbi:hypothetical protein C8R43DRAFT_964670 [Mycena crocata]|nr:hypothetical protein C8R43DRAFT_964670 [Mycena crocata]